MSATQQIGQYRIITQIGRGAMGVVYRAHDLTTDRPVALKVLLNDLESGPELRARFLREAQAARRLVHPNVITVLAAGEDQGRLYIAMELLDGAPLDVYLKRPEAAALTRKLDLMIQICEGLSAAHKHGVIHRDLKPSNLFVQTDGLLKILDFGVARITDSSMTVTGAMLGTPGYMSPEQARGEQVDARSDIFSAGSVFYFMLARRKPFPGSDLATLLRQLQFEDPAPLSPPVPEELAATILYALAKEPANRPSRVEELLTALVRFRRHYQADTRKLLGATRTQFETVDALVKAVTDAGDVLGDPIVEGPVAAFRSIQERFPVLFDRHAGVDDVGLDRTVVASVLRELEEQRQQLTVELDARRALVAQFDEAQRALDAGEARSVLTQLEALASARPSSTRCRELLDRCRQRAREQAPLEERVAEIVAAAHESVNRRDWAAGLAQAREALDLSPDDERAHAAMAAANALFEHVSADEIRRARSAFRRGRYEDGIDQLRRFVESAPQADAVERELTHLNRLRDAIVTEAAASRERIADLLRTARALSHTADVDGALALAREALRLDPTDGQAATLLDELLARQLEDRLAVEKARTLGQRAADAAPLLASARQALQRGYLAIALQAATAAQRVAPGDPDAAHLIEHARAALAADDHETFDLTNVPLAPAIPAADAIARQDRDRDGAIDRAAAPSPTGLHGTAWT